MPLMAAFLRILQSRQPDDCQCYQQEQKRSAEHRIELKEAHSWRLPSTYLATQCRIIPNNSQATAANRKVLTESTPEAGRPNTNAAIGASTPVTIVAAASVFSHVAVSLTRSFWTSGISAPRPPD